MKLIVRFTLLYLLGLLIAVVTSHEAGFRRDDRHDGIVSRVHSSINSIVDDHFDIGFSGHGKWKSERNGNGDGTLKRPKVVKNLLKRVSAVEGVALEKFPHVADLYRNLTRERKSIAFSPDMFRLRVSANGKTYFIHLQPNNEMFHHQAHILVNGKPIVSNQLDSVRVYKGRVLHENHSDDILTNGPNSPYFVPFSDEHPEDLGWARITVMNYDSSDKQPLWEKSLDELQIDGTFTVGGQVFGVKTRSHYEASKRPEDAPLPQASTTENDSKDPLVIFQHSDMADTSFGDNSTTHSCGSEDLFFNSQVAEDYYQEKLRLHQGALSSKMLFKRAPPGCPTAKKILYMYVAADCSYVSNYQGTDKALKQIISDWNQASALYEKTFNIQLGIIQVNLQDTCGNNIPWNQQCSSGYTINQRLSDFSRWRGTVQSDAGLFMLMTRCNTDVTVGVSWLNMVCEAGVSSQGTGRGTEYVTGAAVSSITPTEWLVVAHEIGHSFGAVHDCIDSCNNCCSCGSSCSCGKFIMSPTSDVTTNEFSPCTSTTICNKLPVLGKCLQDPGTRTTITGNVCGNGVKEPGEDCDCGPAEGESCRNNKCCDGATCKYKNGAQCSDNNDLCCQDCKVKAAGAPCRPSRGVCDVEEKCDGNSGVCPIDKYIDDLSTCAIDSSTQGQCASGDCTNRDQQCRLKGSVAGITGECPGYSDQCQMYCQGQNLGGCIKVSGFYVDGSPCSFGGKCFQGECQVDPWGRLVGWFQAHLATGIAILVVVCTILLCCVGRCVQICLLQKKQRNAALSRNQSTEGRYPVSLFLGQSSPPNRNSRVQSFQQPPATPARPKNWVDPALYNGVYNGDEVDLASLNATMNNRQSVLSEPVQGTLYAERGRQTSRPHSLRISTNASDNVSPSRTSAFPRSARLNRDEQSPSSPPPLPPK
jgi:hypothetical protein